MAFRIESHPLSDIIKRDFNEPHSYFDINYNNGESHIRGMLSHVDNVRYVYEMIQFSSGQIKTPPHWFLEKNGFNVKSKLV